MKNLILVLCTLMLVALSLTANAHHSWRSIFDEKGDVEIEGVVTKKLWRNPHIQFQITVDQGKASETVWTIESNAVARLTRMGVSRDTIKVGDTVKAAGFPSLKGEPEMFVNHLLLADQTEVVMSRTAGRRWASVAKALIGDTDALHGGVVEENIAKRPTSIFGSWHVIYGAEGSHRAGRAGGGDPTDHATAFRAKQEAAGLGGRPDRHDCSPRQALSIFGEPYPMAMVDKGDTIEIQLEFLDTYRTVYMDPTKAIPDDMLKDHLGFSRGHWFEDTLVVETKIYREGGVDGDDYMQAHETFHLSADQNRLVYTQVVVDPLMLKTPSVAKKWWQHIPEKTYNRMTVPAGSIRRNSMSIIKKIVPSKIALATTVLLALMLSAQASAEVVEVYLLDRIDGILNHYCIDTNGPPTGMQLDSPLQTHTCYSYKGDLTADQAMDTSDIAKNKIRIMSVDLCAQLDNSEPGATITLTHCDDEIDEQGFKLEETGQFVSTLHSELCITAGPTSWLGGPAGGPYTENQGRTLRMQRCGDEAIRYQRWGTRTKMSE